MIKRAIILLSITLIYLAVQARTTITLSDGKYIPDTLIHRSDSPGISYTSLSLGGIAPVRVHYVTARLDSAELSLRAVCGERLAGRETVEQMARQIEESSPGHTVLAGINADFFVTKGIASDGTSLAGTPLYACIIDKEIYKTSADKVQFTVDTAGTVHIGRLDFSSGTATISKLTVPFTAVNTTATADSGITVYTPRYHRVDSIEGFRTASLRALTAEKLSTCTESAYVITAESDSNSYTMAVPETSPVSKHLEVGDTIVLKPCARINTGENIAAAQCVSGRPRILADGMVLDGSADGSFTAVRHPRSAIGVSADGKTLVMMVVDGRSDISAGVSTSDLAGLMLFAGCSDAINLDGGGSSTLYTHLRGVCNTPSDPRPRKVGNAIYIVSCSSNNIPGQK